MPIPSSPIAPLANAGSRGLKRSRSPEVQVKKERSQSPQFKIGGSPPPAKKTKREDSVEIQNIPTREEADANSLRGLSQNLEEFVNENALDKKADKKPGFGPLMERIRRIINKPNPNPMHSMAVKAQLVQQAYDDIDVVATTQGKPRQAPSAKMRFKAWINQIH
jgi:hypothetical protein